MGLDWMVEPKPMPENQAEYDELFTIISEGRDRDRRTFWQRLFGVPAPPDYSARYDEIAVINPGETLGAPRVGRDDAADEWLRKRYDRMPRENTWPEHHKAMTGYYVLPLAKPCDGLPRYSNGGLATPLLSSFRADHLSKLYGVDPAAVDVALLFVWQTAAELIDTGRILEEDARTYASRTGVGDEVFDRDFTPTDEELAQYVHAPRLNAHVMISASRWCTFWGERGHAMQAWF
ncbi:MAG: hypothetical protein ACTS3R_08830 [Inquilinaceae bacterium]